MNVLDLFSGIGGFSLGLERAGMRTVAFCEIEPFCRDVLRKHWPETPIYEDVRALSAQHLTARGISVDVICGGFPCQDISLAGKGAGIEGERSGLWREYARLVGEIRPRYIIVENVAALLGRGLERVLGDLAALGYDAEWHCIPASAVGAPHRRDRVWIISYDQKADDSLATMAAGQERRPQVKFRRLHRLVREAHARGWEPEPKPRLVRVADRLAHRLDRLGALGNLVVPQIPEIIGRAIMTQIRGLRCGEK